MEYNKLIMRTPFIPADQSKVYARATAMIADRKLRETDRRRQPHPSRVAAPLLNALETYGLAAVITVPELDVTPQDSANSVIDCYTQGVKNTTYPQGIVELDAALVQGERNSRTQVRQALGKMANAKGLFVVRNFRYGRIWDDTAEQGDPAVRDRLLSIAGQGGRVLLIGQSNSVIRTNFNTLSLPRDAVNQAHFAHAVDNKAFLTFDSRDREHAFQPIRILEARVAKEADRINPAEKLPQLTPAQIQSISA
jgi:hypothetical protein